MDVLVQERGAEVTRFELLSLYDLLRTSDLNIRYYGRKVARLTRQYRTLQTITALASAGAVAGFVQQVPLWGKTLWVLFAGLAALTSAAASVYDLPTQIARFEHLHSGYQELFHQLELLLHDIRRTGQVTSEHLGASRVLQQMYTRMGPKDEPDPDRKLIGELQNEVNQAFPPESLWIPQ